MTILGLIQSGTRPDDERVRKAIAWLSKLESDSVELHALRAIVFAALNRSRRHA